MPDPIPFLRRATVIDGEQIQGWFANADQLFAWGGPGLTWGLPAHEFCQQIKLDHLHSMVLTDGKRLLGFAQCYVRLGRHHLGRIAIAPEQRGKGLGTTLLRLLCEYAPSQQTATGFSLFVLPQNTPAKNMYIKLGFREAPYPEPIPGDLNACLYMIRDGI